MNLKLVKYYNVAVDPNYFIFLPFPSWFPDVFKVFFNLPKKFDRTRLKFFYFFVYKFDFDEARDRI